MYPSTYLQETVYYLSPHILLVRREEFALQQAKDASRDAIIGLKVFGYSRSTLINVQWKGRGTFVAGGDIEEGAQRVVDDLVFLAARRHDIVELCTAC